MIAIAIMNEAVVAIMLMRTIRLVVAIATSTLFRMSVGVLSLQA